MSGKKEAVVIGVFLATMVGFFLSSQLGGLIYIIRWRVSCCSTISA